MEIPLHSVPRAELAPGRRIADTTIDYTAPIGVGSTRRVRVWDNDAGTRTCVVTERPADSGTSITNAPSALRAALRERFGGAGITLRVIEHYPADTITGEHFDQIDFDGDQPSWRRLDTAELADACPGLLDEPDADAETATP